MQGRHTSWLIAGLVLLFGLLGALPFQNDAAPPASDPYAGTVADGIVWQDPVSSPNPLAASVESALTLGSSPGDSVAPVTALTAVTPSKTEVPKIDAEYGSLLRDYERRGDAAAAASRAPAPIPHSAAKPATQRSPVRRSDRPAPLATTAAAAGAEPAAPRQFAPPIVRSLPRAEVTTDSLPGIAPPRAAQSSVPQTEQPETRSHKVRDGDTLESIALRYLGQATRAAEIYEANRDLLRDPALLPIGVQLRIPPRRAPLNHAAAEPPASQGASWEMRRLPAVK